MTPHWQPPNLGQREIPQPRRPWPYRSDEYEQGYDAGFNSGLASAHHQAWDRAWCNGGPLDGVSLVEPASHTVAIPIGVNVTARYVQSSDNPNRYDYRPDAERPAT